MNYFSGWTVEAQTDEGDQVLITSDAGEARVIDLDRGIAFPPCNPHTVLKHGGWVESKLTIDDVVVNEVRTA